MMRDSSELQFQFSPELCGELNQITETALRILPAEANELVTVICGYLQLITSVSSRPQIRDNLRRSLVALANLAQEKDKLEFVDHLDFLIRRLQ